NLFGQGLLILLRLKPGEEVEARLSQEEVRSLVLAGHFFRGKHRAMLSNLFDLASASVVNVMTPRHQIATIDVTDKPALLAQQLATSYHTMLPVYENSLDNIIG